MVFNSQAFKAPQLGRKRVSMKKTLGDVAQSGVNPATGEYLSSGQRKALFKKRTVSTEKVFGKPGALVKINNLESIVKTGKDEEKKGESSTDTESLGTRVSSLEKSIVTIQESIKKLSEFLVDDAKKEQQLLLKGQKTEDITKEKQKRRRKESGLESVAKGIGNTLLAPIKAIGGKVKGILSRVLEFLKILFVGWLTDKGIKAFRAYMDGNKEEFERIRNNILGALGIVAGIIAGVSGGLAAIPGLVLGIIPTIATIGTAIVGFLLSPAGLATIAFLGVAGLAGLGIQYVDKSGLKTDYGNKQEYMEEGAFSQKLRRQYGSSATEKEREKNLTPSEKKEYALLQKYDQELQKRGQAFNRINVLEKRIPELERKAKGENALQIKSKQAINDLKRDKEDLIKQRKIFENSEESLRQIRGTIDLNKLGGKTLGQVKTDFDSGKIIQTGISQAETPQKSRVYGLGSSIKQKVEPQEVTPPSTPTATPTPPVTSLAQTRTVPTAEPKKKPTVIFRPNPQVQQKEPASVTNGNSETPNISSSNPNNFYTMYSQIQYNVVR